MKHKSDLKGKKVNKPLYDHSLKVPNGSLDSNNFSMKITGFYRNLLPRIVAEDVKLDQLVAESRQKGREIEIMNSNNNFHQSKRIRFRPVSQII